LLREDEKYLYDQLMEDGGMPEIDDAVRRIQTYRSKTYTSSKGNPLVNKNRYLEEWEPTEDDIKEIVVCIFNAVLAHGRMSYQGLCGMLNHKIKVEDLIDRVNIIASCTALVSKTGLVTVDYGISGEYIMVDTEYEMDDLLLTDRHGTIFHRPQLVESNMDPEQGSMILGGKLKHHNGFICLDHINKMNQIPLCLNKEFLMKYPETPKDGFLDEGDPEWKLRQKEDLWDLYVEQSQEKIFEILSVKTSNKNRIYLNHKYCTRGRSYATGYYINSQGSSFKKASLQLANKEYLNK